MTHVKCSLGPKCTSPPGLRLFIAICREELWDAFSEVCVCCRLSSELCWGRIR